MEFIPFRDWITKKTNGLVMNEKRDTQTLPGNSELLALIEELDEKRNAASRANDGIGRQIFDLDIRVAKLDMQKNELLYKRKELEKAKVISEQRKKTPRGNEE